MTVFLSGQRVVEIRLLNGAGVAADEPEKEPVCQRLF